MLKKDISANLYQKFQPRSQNEVAEMFDSLQHVSAKCAPQYELNSCYHGTKLGSRPPQ